MAKIHSDHSASKESLLPHETFIMALCLKANGSRFLAQMVLLGQTGDEDPEVVKLTRILDAFQHFVLQNSEEGLIITDLQGILHW